MLLGLGTVNALDLNLGLAQRRRPSSARGGHRPADLAALAPRAYGSVAALKELGRSKAVANGDLEARQVTAFDRTAPTLLAVALLIAALAVHAAATLGNTD